MKNYISAFFLIFFSLNIYSQGESIGSTTSNYSGVNSVWLNPSAMHNQKSWLSFNFASGNMFFHTDYAYLDNAEFRLSNLLDSNYVLPSHFTGYGAGGRQFYIYDKDKNTSFDQSIRVAGPSLMISYNKHAFAITTTSRMQTNVRNITPDLGNILYYGLSYSPQYLTEFEVDDFSATSMAWTEIGLSYAYRINKHPFNEWSFGISLKRLLGAGGGYFDVQQSTYTLVNSSTVAISSQQAEIGLSAPVDFETGDFVNYNLLNGRGWAFDIGFTYQALLTGQTKLNAQKFCEQPLVDYKYRIGVALLDVGSITYNQNAQTHDFSSPTNADGDLAGVELVTLNQIFERMSDEFYGSPSASFVENSMRISLPMALSVQADYNTEISNLYWNASLIYGIPVSGGALRRPSQITVTPRYETRAVEFSIPLSLYRFQYPHIGIYARIGPFGIGSDWISSFFGNQDFHGMDFYFTAKFQLSKDNCRSKRIIKDACRNR